MNRSFYFLGVSLSGLFLAMGVFHSIIYFLLGERTIALQSFEDWYIIFNIIYFIVSLILLRYYYSKKYWFTLFAGIILTITSLLHFIIVLNNLEAGESGKYFNVTYSISVGAGILYAISLIFSYAGSRTWLKTAGVFILISQLLRLSVFIWSITSHDIQKKLALAKFQQWTSLASEMILIFFILNYLAELGVIKDEKNKTTRSEALDGILYMLGIIALTSTFIFGQKIAGECYWYLDWLNKGPERMKIYVRDFEARTYGDSPGKSLNYRLLKPLAYDHNRKYPLILCLSYGKGNDNISQIDGSPEAQFLSQPANRKNYPAFIIVPQCPPGSTWGGIGKYPDVDSLVFNAIYVLEKEFEIDQSRLYVMGESMGGFGTWHFISVNPKMFAAAIPICGGGDTSLASNIFGVHVWAFHGRKDRNVPVKYSRTMIEYLKKAGGDPKYTEFPNEGHYISESVKNTSGLLDWLFAQKREN